MPGLLNASTLYSCVLVVFKERAVRSVCNDVVVNVWPFRSAVFAFSLYEYVVILDLSLCMNRIFIVLVR